MEIKPGNPLLLPMPFVGIDPAFRERGFAICIIDEHRDVDFKVFYSFLEFLTWLHESPDKCFVCIENSNLQNVTFGISKMSKAEVAAKSRDVGKNQAISQCTVDACVRKFGDGYVAGVTPYEKGEKITSDLTIKRMAKSEFLTITKKRLNQDERDAFKLAIIGIRIYKAKMNKYQRI